MTDQTARGTEYKRSQNGIVARARDEGKKFYDPQKPCRRGHVAPRRVSNSNCTRCETEHRKIYRSTDVYQQRRRASYEKSYAADPSRYLYDRAKGRARRKNIPFDIALEDVQSLWYGGMVCPVLGIPLKPNVGGLTQIFDSPSLDRIKPHLGYVKGNIAIISCKANQMKMDSATPGELRQLADWLEVNDAMGNVEAFAKILELQAKTSG